MKNRSHHHDHQNQGMPLDEVQGLLPPSTRSGNRGPLNVTIVQVSGGNGSGGGNEYLGAEPTLELKPTPSPLSETSATLASDNNDTFTGMDSEVCLAQTLIEVLKYLVTILT
ncbi:hypothetical protein PV325_011842 [Microctonus aethiopoides]|nr:hypothetical protein PV325_011842 [Microctonus aethiopoides]KAK0093313.1 hypothetical protein PV326_013838 [Microctonus aethiopoides]